MECLVLRVGATRAEVWSLPVYAVKVDGIIQEDAVLESFFPKGCISVVLCTVTDAYNPLPFAYRVYLDNHKAHRPLNNAVESVFDQMWIGNIVIIKYGRSKGDDRLLYTNLQRGEAELVLCILQESVYPDFLWFLRV